MKKFWKNRRIYHLRSTLLVLSFCLLFSLTFQLIPRKSVYFGYYSISLDPRAAKLKNFLSANKSPLAQYSDYFVQEADRNGLDWRLLPAIAGVESTYGLHIPYNSFNAYGWGGGRIYFKNWEESISQVSSSLATKYVAKGKNTVEKIAFTYNPATPVEWGQKVNRIMRLIENHPLRNTEVSELALDI